jgi:hypothetical protein
LLSIFGIVKEPAAEIEGKVNGDTPIAGDTAVRARRAGKLPPQSRLKLSHLRLIVALEDAEMVGAAAQSMKLPRSP